MTTEKRIEANKENALLSTGPRSEEGKAVVSKNAVKHGIFTSELIIEQGEGKESRAEYEALLQNLTDYFDPRGQLESALVEKIAVDFWRLKRVIRFETGSIRRHLDFAVEEFFAKKDYLGNPVRKSDRALEEEIEHERQALKANDLFLEALKKGKVDLSKPVCQIEGVRGDWDLSEDYLMIAEGVADEAGKEIPDRFSFADCRKFLSSEGYSEGDIKQTFIAHYQDTNARSKRRIEEKRAEIEKNAHRAEVQSRVHALPSDEVTDKVLRYERSIEKAIFQKIIMLKNLQRVAAP